MHKMATLHSSIVSFSTLPPSEAPSFHSAFVKSFRHLIIVLSLHTTFVFLLFLFFLGRMRRSVRGRRFLRNATKICYLLIPISITYIMGGLHKDPKPHALSPVWASILIYAYGGVVTITACDLRDNEETLRYAWHMLPLFFWTFWLGLIVCISSAPPCLAVLVCTLVFFLVLAIINTQQTLRAFYIASKSKGLPHFVEPIIRYMKTLGEEDIIPNPRTMQGCKYVVHGNSPSEHETFTTIGEIWECFPAPNEKEDEETSEAASLGRENKFQAKYVNNERLRDICLSYALFRMLLTRFAGFPPTCNKNRITPKRFIQDGLISWEPQHDVDRAFRVIEVELDYLFDFFYTKSHACGPYRFRDIWQHVVQILLLLSFGMLGVPLIVSCDFDSRSQDGIEDLEIVGTMAVILVFVLLEFCKYIMVQFSNLKIVWLVCTYVRQAKSKDKKWASTTKWRIVLICTIKHFLIDRCRLDLFCLFKPWQRKLGQYSFLKSYGQVPIFARKLFSPLGKVIKLSRDGQCGDSIVSLSKEVKEAIVSSFERILELKLSRGTLERYGLTERCELTEISNTYRSLESDAHFILVWHIATDFCEFNHPVESKTDHDHGHFLAATQLSKYCAYLLAFSPELLPDHPYTAECLFDEAVKQARKFKKEEGLDMHDLYKKLISRVDIDQNIVVRGALLAHELAEYVINTPNRGWKVLAEFWAEVLLYLAPSDDVGVHGEYLAKGGEFITHLWALLTHTGVFTRESSSQPSKCAN